MSIWVNQRAGGDGGIALSFHALRPQPAAPQHGWLDHKPGLLR